MSTNSIVLKASDHPVKSVTIFQSSIAELTRTFVAELQSGRNVIEIYGISSHVDTKSSRIHGLGMDARVFDISCSIRKPPSNRNVKNRDAIKGLVAKRNALVLERNLRQQEYDMLNEAGKSLANETPAQIDKFVDGLVKRKRDAMKAVQEYDEKIEDVDEKLWELRDTHKGETAGRVVATILAKRECKVEFQLTYLVTGAKWQPHYDLHASTLDGKTSSDVTLVYCANITQSTGEDWNDTVLTLSTANSHALKSLSVPTIDPLRVSPLRLPPVILSPPPPAPMMAPHTRMRRQPLIPTVTAAREDDSDDDLSVIEPSNGEAESGTTVDHNPLSLAYRVDGAVTLPSDGVAHKVSIAMLDFSAELKYVCVPRKTTSAFIEATVKNTSDYELLAGPVSVFMDDGFVTKTSLGLIGVNENFDCVLGVDTSLKVSYHQRSHTSHEPPRSFAEPSKTTTCTTTTTITNGHQFDISGLLVRDAIPLGNDEANIKVMLRKPDGLAQAKDGDEVVVDLGEDVKDAKVRWTKVGKGKGGEKDGMYEWVCGVVAAGKEVRLEAEWYIKSPTKLQWEET